MARSPDNDDFSATTPNRRSESAMDFPAPRSPARRGGVRGMFAADRLWSGVKTLAWLVPLTVLIWIYAEQQQELKQTVNGVSITLQSTVANRSTDFADGVQQVAVNLTLQGPRLAVDRVGKQLLAPPGLQLDVGSRGLGALDVNIVSAAQNLPLFRQAGVTVMEAQPPDVRVNVDSLIEREATVMLPPHAMQFSGTVTFDPPKVKLRGPTSQMDAIAVQANGSLVVYADLLKVDLQQPGDHAPETVALTAPAGVTAQPPQVLAKVRVTTAYKDGVINSVPIHIDADLSLQKDYFVQLGDGDDQSIAFVHVTGPADKVDLVTGPSPRVQVTAQLKVQREDLGQDRQGTLTIADLPEGVKPTAADAARKTPFRLVPRP